MTKINKIVMNGFKSFGKRTELVFDDHFNVVLGPNGAGKSNVLDALCFVLGKSSTKSLRAEKSANLIYNGGKAKQPAKSGEVSIYFDNSKNTFPTNEKEVKITRLVKHNGQSVYKINDKARTRQQIMDLMSVAKINPDGYNIILQGDITHFAEMHPVERREVIEEIVGISVYEEKKRKALNELDKVEERLKEAEIILLERSTYLKELKKDRDQALKFKDLKDKINQNKATYINLQLQEKLRERKKYDDALGDSRGKIEKIQREIDELKKDLREKRAEIDEINKRIEKDSEQEQLKVHKDVEKMRTSIEADKQRVQACKNEISRINSRKEQLTNNLGEVEGKIREMKEEKERLIKRKSTREKERQELEDKISKFKEKYKLEDTGDMEKKIEEIDGRAEEIQKEIEALRVEQQNLLREKDRIDFQIQTTDERINKVSKVKKENSEQIENLKKKREEFKKLTLEVNSLSSEDTSISVQLSGMRERILKLNEESARLNARSIGAKERAAESLAVRKITEENIKGVYGTIAALGKVSAKYSLSLEVAAGPRLNSIVVDSDVTAAKCIKYLKEKKLGTATFLPLNKIKSSVLSQEQKNLAKSSGAHGFALELIKYESSFKNAFSYVFGNTLVVDNIDVARRLGVGEMRMATLDGDLVERSGAMHGGYRKKKGSFQEEDLSSDITSVEKKLKEAEELLKTLQKRKKEVENKLSSGREGKAILEGEAIKLEKSLHLEEGDLEASRRQKDILEKNNKEIEGRISDIQKKIQQKNSALTGIKTEKQSLREQINQLKKPTLIAELNTFEQKKQELREAIIEISASIKNIDTQIKDIFDRDKENTLKIVKQQEKEEVQFLEEIKVLSKKVEVNQELLSKKEEKERQYYQKFRGLFNKKSKLDEELQKTETKIIRREEEIRGIESKSNVYSVENARIKAEVGALEEEAKQFAGLKLLANKTKEELKKEINDFEKMMDSIGSVNMRALDVYERVEKEHRALVEKKEKLLEEKEDVVKMMGEIETRKKDLFMNTFNTLKKNFIEIFSSLTTKGEAHLELEDPENPFEAGVIFRVRITGNKFLDIRGLSGGEKTLTAIAFIFSIQEYEPASFYVLDEVDAALDKHNSEKLAKLIKKYSNNAQYIIISHNDALITEADTLYGVSMNEHSMSNVVSLKI